MKDHILVYRVGPQETSAAPCIDRARRIFGPRTEFASSERNGDRILHNEHQTVEIASASGGAWAADWSRLWKPTERRVPLPTKAEAATRAREVAQEGQLLPRLAAPFRFGKPRIGHTFYLVKRRGGRREGRRLDVHVAYPIRLGDTPVVGGGSAFRTIFGEQGKVIGFSGCWRPTGKAFRARLIGRRTADEQFRALTEHLERVRFKASLAYYAAPSFRHQEFLCPVYVYRAKARISGRMVPLRHVILPASEDAPPADEAATRPPCSESVRPASGDDLHPGEQPRAPESPSPGRTPAAGTSWKKLKHSKDNAQGFIDEWTAAGWNIAFNRGEGQALETDFRRNAQAWVERADFVFYSGHADMYGWALSPPDDQSIHHQEVARTRDSTGRLFGSGRLKWLTIAACGPLQDKILADRGGDVFKRWGDAFDGMHILMGYGSVCYDNAEEGRRMARYAKEGSTLINAWFRAAMEIQPSTNGWSAPNGPNVYAGALWAGNEDADAGQDHACGFGPVSPDPRPPAWFAAMWTPC